ncbi:MAG TPA: GMC oxidoreductase [Gemmatimonadales bacterium]|nr:GMC oxidoreductase [Gemmatimonadales bacterium]
MNVARCDVAIIGSGAGGGTAALALAPLVAEGKRVLVLERGPRFRDGDFTGRELEMAGALYADEGGFLTRDETMTLAFARGYGGSTLVYTGTSLVAPARVIRGWGVPGIEPEDLARRSGKYMEQNNVHLLDPALQNDNNRLFAVGAARAGFHPEQFPLNLRGCLGSSLCNLGCPNNAKQGTNRVQLPAAERQGVQVVTRAEVTRIEERRLRVRVSPRPPGGKGEEPEWAPGEYLVEAAHVVLAGGVMGTVPLLLGSGLPGLSRRTGEGFTCHPAHILVGEHPAPISNDVGHPKSWFVDRAAEDGFVLETCMYFPFITAKNLTGFGAPHSALMRAFPRLQMILVLACDHAVPGNRITVDRHGAPVAHYTFTRPVIESMVRATRASARIFFAAGAIRVHAPSADPPLVEASETDRLEERIHARHFLSGRISISAAHLMGGCGMGTDPGHSVTDDRGRVHGYPWLRVADASLFPDSLEINPYLTIMALADRVAEGLLGDVGKGAP